jgi:hypothetical protein
LENTITLSNAFLQEKVKNDYADHKVALIREFLQNSCDAGATKLDFMFDKSERTLTVTDNGCGMDAKIMVNALFDIGGSYKEGNDAVGGFGSAKLILLFQHDQYDIKSWRDGVRYEVNGRASSYSNIESFDDVGLTGTSITIKFLDSWAVEDESDSYSMFEYYAKEFLEQCDVTPKVTWNGMDMNSRKAGTIVRELEWGNIYCDDTTQSQYYVDVRIGGIKMFQIYVGEINKKLTIELTHKSINILTTNRDGLRGGYSDELSSVVKEFNVNNVSFGKKLHGQTIIYEGSESSFFDMCASAIVAYKTKIVEKLKIKRDKADNMRSVLEFVQISKQIEEFNKYIKQLEADSMADLVDDASQDDIENPIAHFLTNIMERPVAYRNSMLPDRKIHLEVVTEVEEAYKTSESTTTYDFLVDVKNDIDALPAKFDPKKGMSQKYFRLAQLWKASINYILDAENVEMKYKIGWVIEDEIQTSFSIEHDVKTFLINPESQHWFEGMNKTQCVKRIFRTACHELTHSLGFKWHDESFIAKCDTLREHEDSISNWKQFELNAYEEII